jgi:hypothetical protein
MYAYIPFSPHNGITSVNVLILLYSPINDNFNFHGIIINLLLLYRLPYFVFLFVNYFCVLLRTRANFVIGL